MKSFILCHACPDKLNFETRRKVARIKSTCFGSLGATGRGHGTDRAIIAGFLGHAPSTVDPATLNEIGGQPLAIHLGLDHTILINPGADLEFHCDSNTFDHPNTILFTAYDLSGNELLREKWYSVGGGAVIKEGVPVEREDTANAPYPFSSGADLLFLCRKHSIKISDIALANESVIRPESETRQRLNEIWNQMRQCISRGFESEGHLPGGLNVRRRAKQLHQMLLEKMDFEAVDPLNQMDWVNLYALSVNEENAAGGRVVTAPTNGSAGIIPAVLMYADRFQASPYPDGVQRFLLAAGSIGILYKKNASLSGAEVGCQGEVGVACSMAAAGLTEFCGGTPEQVENAAEIGMEHNLGLTCDPVAGLVQIPCIERNAMGAIKAIDAARLALSGSGHHSVTLDQVIETMMQTGRDMQDAYKETSKGGLARNVPQC